MANICACLKPRRRPIKQLKCFMGFRRAEARRVKDGPAAAQFHLIPISDFERPAESFIL